VGEFEVGVVGAEFIPQAMHAKGLGMNGGVVEEDDCGVGELGAPGVKIVANGGVIVEAIEVEEVDGVVGEAGKGPVEGGLQEGGEGFVAGMVGAEIFEDARGVGTGLRVAAPGVDGGGAAIKVEGFDGLEEGAVRVAVVGAEFDEGARAEEVDEQESEGDVAEPGGGLGKQARGFEEEGMVQGVEGVGCPPHRKERERGVEGGGDGGLR
jgi:hypothetical protein